MADELTGWYAEQMRRFLLPDGVAGEQLHRN